MMAPVCVFVCYAHEGERQLKHLDSLLDVLELHHGLTSWRDRRLIAGEQWDEEIRLRPDAMDIFLFIASQASVVRPYIKNIELKRAIERKEKNEIEIVTVRLEPCACDEDPVLGKLQRLAANYKIAAQVSPGSIGWEQVRKDLLPVIRKVRESKNRERPVS